MGRWGDSFFDDDLALDLQADFARQVEGGAAASTAAAKLLNSETASEILNEFSDDQRDELFWEECSGLIFGAAILQLENDALQPETKKLALEAISAERKAGANDGRLRLLAELEGRLVR